MWQDARDFQSGILACIRADLRNTSARDFARVYEPADFMPGASDAIEERVAQLIAEGYGPAAAAALASSKVPKEKQIRAIDSIKPRKAGRANRVKRA